MKKWGLLFVCLVAFWVYPCLGESAGEAADLTKECVFSASSGQKISRLTDSKIKAVFETKKQENAYIQIDAPAPVGGLYIIWENEPSPWSLQTQEEGVWTQAAKGAPYGFVHEFIEVPGKASLRIAVPQGEKAALKVAEIRVYGMGDIPAAVQRWEPTPKKAELMVISAHPDDEYIFFGGVIPYYAGQLKKDVVVCYMTCGNRTRRTELLNGLWKAGLRAYPVIGSFPDKYCSSLSKGYEIWGKGKTLKYVTGLFRQYKPQVVVTHDLKGEYGHGGHRACGDAAVQCAALAQDPEKYPESYEAYGAWEVEKLYIHLYPENQLTMDWTSPLSAFEGKTALEIAAEAFDCHVTQQRGAVTVGGKKFVFDVYDHGRFDNAVFGLAYTAVGADAALNDFFEHIEE